MDGNLGHNAAQDERRWAADICAEISRLAKNGQFDLVEGLVTNAILDAKQELGHAPAATALFWAINAALPEEPFSAACERLLDCFEAFHAINLYTFQTIHCAEPFKATLAKERLTAARIPTEIWLEWAASRDQSPVEAAVAWMDQKHRAFGLGRLFTLDSWNPAKRPGAISQSTAAEIVAFAGRA